MAYHILMLKKLDISGFSGPYLSTSDLLFLALMAFCFRWTVGAQPPQYLALFDFDWNALPQIGHRFVVSSRKISAFRDCPSLSSNRTCWKNLQLTE